MNKKHIYLSPGVKSYTFQALSTILAGSTEAGTTPFLNEEEEYTL